MLLVQVPHREIFDTPHEVLDRQRVPASVIPRKRSVRGSERPFQGLGATTSPRDGEVVRGGGGTAQKPGSRPSSGNTARRVAMIAWSSRLSGEKPSSKCRYDTVAPSPMVSGAYGPIRPPQSCGVGVPGASGVPPTMASRWVQARGTTCRTAYPPPPVETQ